MRLPQLLLLGAGLALAGAAQPALAGGKSGMHMPRPGMGWQQGGHRWGPRHSGRWYAGWRAPGGWSAYRRPVRGYILPRYWIAPSFYISNYGAYGLPAPATGYGWSRYYDDAVMTDRYGRVYDYRGDIDWDRYEGGYGPDEARDGYYADAPRRDNGLGGAAIGAVVGGVAGNRIAGRGNRTEGTLIGAGVGALAGMAIDKAEDGPHHAAPPPRRPGAGYDYGYGYGDDTVTSANEYEGRWTGTWTTDDGKKVSGTYEGRFEGDVRGAGVDYYAPPYAAGPHWSHGPAPIVTQGGGYISGGYYYPAPIVTTVTVQPATSTTTTTTYVSERVVSRRPARRSRAACRCK
ncbi:Ni/Co efflux regulator RcnB [Sphingobium sp. OAS761]|uniref:RcnB family protein n=1 Tax=Sphingobium sp. OAS761 TaxID=2817901 RepID=UPI00209E2BFC|nr:RcnB family protein [Sphingobium sp. OAS761]MCP1470865.1 Ni/Co efflux regulator RcnB [Sphingobium sp. OAS761]